MCPTKTCANLRDAAAEDGSRKRQAKVFGFPQEKAGPSGVAWGLETKRAEQVDGAQMCAGVQSVEYHAAD